MVCTNLIDNIEGFLKEFELITVYGLNWFSLRTALHVYNCSKFYYTKWCEYNIHEFIYREPQSDMEFLTILIIVIF